MAADSRYSILRFALLRVACGARKNLLFVLYGMTPQPFGRSAPVGLNAQVMP
jgi:hypothetical protein